jgi:hypothetical protein
MNDWDRNNLDFLLKSNDQTFTQFLEESSEEDLAYALELIAKARIENELETTSMLDDVEDTTQAQAILARFRL